ncbi:MAG: hypothetical protein AAFN10_19935 [Bacteroidota bacterium]
MKNDIKMPNSLLIRDESPEGDCMNTFCLTLKGEFGSISRGAKLLAPKASCITLAAIISQTVDLEKQVFRALDAFKTRAYVLFVNGTECKSLDQIVKIADSPNISFVIFQPLIG